MNVKDFIIQHPGAIFDMMTPSGYVHLTPEMSRALLNGENVKGHPGTPEYAMEILAGELLPQTVHGVNFSNGAWHMLTDYTQEPTQYAAPDRNEILERFKEKLEKNLRDYRADLLLRDQLDLIEMSKEIDATFTTYDELRSGGYSAEYLEYLLRFDNPLEVVRDHWIQHNDLPVNEEMSCVLWHIMDSRDAEQDYELDEGHMPPGMEQGVTMC